MRPAVIENSAREVEVLDILSEKLKEKLTELYASLGARPKLDEYNFDLEVGRRGVRENLAKAFDEIASRGYGRVVFVDEFNEEEIFTGRKIFRISQANMGFVEDPVRLLPRNTPFASEIASCSLGDELILRTKAGERYYKVKGIADIDGMTHLLHTRPDAKLARFKDLGEVEEVVRPLRRFVIEANAPRQTPLEPAEAPLQPLPDLVALPTVPKSEPVGDKAPPTPERAVDAFWKIDEERVLLSEDNEQSLGSEFFTRTTRRQEEAIQTVRGLVIVQGVAGSGKTSVALGRMKFFANFRSGENLEEYGLKSSDQFDFDARNMIGFVLSRSLVAYLQRTRDSLELREMKIQDFDEFVSHERNTRGVFGKPFRKVSVETSSHERTIAWLDSLDKASALYVADQLRSIFAEPLAKPESQDGARISALRWERITALHWTQGQLPLRVKALIRELTATDYRDSVRFLLKGVASELDQRIRVGDNESSDLEPLERRVLREAVESVQMRSFRLLNPQELYIQAFQQNAYRTVLEERCAANGIPIDDTIAPIATRIAAKTATEDDVVGALSLNAVCCDGFRREIKAIPYLVAFEDKVGVFIDEYQDFGALQIFLMGSKAKRKYNLVTVAGDASQRLHAGGTGDAVRALPWASSDRRVFLDRNMRQPEHMARLSTAFRALTDSTLAMPEDPLPATLATYDDAAEFAADAATHIQDLSKDASLTVICATVGEVELWYGLMREELEAGFRSPSISEKAQLTARYRTHFTTALEAKGLEFDAVVVPDISSFDQDDPIALNALYVAVSRPRHAILLGCKRDGLTHRGVEKLLLAGFLTVSERIH